MTSEQAKKMLKAKLECLKRETSGTDFDCNNSNCDECSLCYEQGNMGEQKEALEMAIKALEQIDKIKRLFKTKMRTMTRDEFNEDFEDSTISDIKDEMWELYIFLHKIEEVLEDKAESEVNVDDNNVT